MNTEVPSNPRPVESERWLHYQQRYSEQFRQRARLLTFSRLILIATVCFISVVVTPTEVVLSLPTLVCLGLVVVASLGYHEFIKRSERFDTATRAYIASSLLFDSLLLFVTVGPINIGFTLLYFTTVVAATLLVSARAGYVSASICSVTLALITAIFYLANYQKWDLPLVDLKTLALVSVQWRSVVVNLVQISLALHVVAFLTDSLPYRVSGVRILYEDLLGELKEGVVAIDNSGRIVYVNTEAKRLFHWESIPNIVGELMPEVLRRSEDRVILEVLTVDSDLHGEIEMQTPVGPIPIEVRTTVMKDSYGALKGVVGIFTDLTHKHQVARSEKRLEKLKVFEEMAMGIAHEIRNPLASIRGAMQELARRAFNDEDDRLLAQIILKESDRLDVILDQFMGYARMRPVEKKPVDLRALLDEIVKLLKLRDDADGVHIERDDDPGLADLDCIVDLDRDQMTQVLLNLGVNALHALKGKGLIYFGIVQSKLVQKQQRVGQRVFEPKQALAIEVYDDGPGIPHEVRGQLFTPFFSTKSGGNGLGLAIAQKIVNAHGGDLLLDENEEIGTRFRIQLPVPIEASRSDP